MSSGIAGGCEDRVLGFGRGCAFPQTVSIVNQNVCISMQSCGSFKRYLLITTDIDY